MSLVKMWFTNFSASGPVTKISPIWDTSKTPTALRTARCSSVMSVYLIGISKPANGLITAPRATCLSCKQVLSIFSDSIIDCKYVIQIRVNLVTIPEGLTLKEIAEIVSKKGICSVDEFMEAIKTNKFTVNGEELKNIEGFLLPNTYDIPKEYTPFQIEEMMIKSFDEKITPIYLEKKSKLPVNLTLKEVVTLASLVEREASVPEERPIIAGVYYNRLKIGMRLECDATIQYALGHQKKELLYSDLEIDSPYNTYKHEGLPPGPIANPGEESLKSVLNPTKHNYYFYVLNGIKNNGTHVFSETAWEHEKAVNKYLR